MSVKTYSRKTDARKRIAKNFLVGEFACHDGADKILLSEELVVALQAIRDHFGAPVKITSGYRTPYWNKHVGGVSNSQHVLGKAADINVDGQTPMALYRAIDNGWVPGVCPTVMGLGVYLSFFHIDVRGQHARWSGKGVGV